MQEICPECKNNLYIIKGLYTDLRNVHEDRYCPCCDKRFKFNNNDSNEKFIHSEKLTKNLSEFLRDLFCFVEKIKSISEENNLTNTIINLELFTSIVLGNIAELKYNFSEDSLNEHSHLFGGIERFIEGGLREKNKYGANRVCSTSDLASVFLCNIENNKELYSELISLGKKFNKLPVVKHLCIFKVEERFLLTIDDFD